MSSFTILLFTIYDLEEWYLVNSKIVNRKL